MISSKTHEIIEIPRFNDPLLAFEEVIVKNNYKYLEEAENHLKFIQLKRKEWRGNMNYAWAITCGFLPYMDCIKSRCLPTIDYVNYMDYVFDETIYICPNPKNRDIVFDYTLNPKCPNCNKPHVLDEAPVVRLENLWADFPIFCGIADFGANFKKVMDEVSKLNYPHARMRTVK